MKHMGERLAMSIVTGAGSVFLKHGLNILLLPILIHTLGVELFSLYMILISIQELTLLLDMGFTDAVVKQLSGLQGSEEHLKGYGEIKKIGHTLFATVSIFVLFFGFSIIPFFPHWLNLDPELHTLSQLSLAIILLEGAITLYITHYKSLLLTHCLNHWSNVGDTVFNFVGIGIGVALLVSGQGLIGLLLARLFGALVRGVIIITQTLKIESDAFWPKASFNFSRLKEMGRLTFHAMMVNFSIIISHKIDTFVIAFFLPLTAVGCYEIVFRFLGSALQVCIKICDSTFPLFARLMASSEKNLSEKEKARQLFLRISCFNNFVISLLLLIIVSFYPELFKLFSAGRMDIAPTLPVLALAVPVIWSSALQIPACYFLYVANRQRYLSISSVLASLSNLTLSLILVKPFGITGVAAGTLIPQFIQHQFSLIYTACKELNIGFKEYVTEVYSKVFVIISLAFLALQSLKHFFLYAAEPMVFILFISFIVSALSVWAWFAWTATTQEKTFFVLKLIYPCQDLKKALKTKLMPEKIEKKVFIQQ